MMIATPKAKKEPKTFSIRTYGCQMNELDSELMVGALLKRGLKRVNIDEKADLMIFNTCSIRDLAERKVMGKIGQLTRKKSHQPIIGVTGCMAMAKKDSLFKKLPHIDFVLGTNNINDLNDVIDEITNSGKKTIKTETRFEENLNYFEAERDDKIKAYISIIRGCDKYCTYCVVPYTRGREVSRPSADIVAECQKLADQGYKEVMLLGQNVNSYGKDEPKWNERFHDLLSKVDAVEGIERIRFMTSHPVDITQDLMYAIRDLPSMCELVHFPIQAGSNRILKKMHRMYTKEEYIEKVQMLRKIVPDVKLGTDIIVGFPTESEEDFQETVDVFKEIGYSLAFIYAYSARKGTPAMRFKDDIPEEVKQERLQILLEIYHKALSQELAGMVGSELEVLVERKTKQGRLKGRTRCWKNVLFEGDDSLIGSFQKVKVSSHVDQRLLAHLSSDTFALN